MLGVEPMIGRIKIVLSMQVSNKKPTKNHKKMKEVESNKMETKL